VQSAAKGEGIVVKDFDCMPLKDKRHTFLGFVLVPLSARPPEDILNGDISPQS
jgi:hypothetical protein